jgi:hypothetical protein
MNRVWLILDEQSASKQQISDLKKLCAFLPCGKYYKNGKNSR